MPEKSGVPGLRLVSYVLRFAVGLTVLILAAGVFGFLYATKPEPTRTPHAERAVVVRVMEAREMRVPRVWEGHGTARAMDAAEVSAQVSARVIERPRRIEPGAAVVRGEVLARLDPTDFAQRVAGLKETIASWEAQLSALDVEQRRLTDRVELGQDEVGVEQRELDRIEQAMGAGAGTQSENERRRASLARKRGELTALQQRLESIPSERARLRAMLGSERANLVAAEENLARATVTAPIDGVLQRVDVREGEMVSPGQVVARVVDLRRIEAPLRLPISAMGIVKVGDRAELRTDTPFLGSTPPTWIGVISRVAPEADPQTRTATVFVEVTQDPGVLSGEPRGTPLLPGQFVVGDIMTESARAYVVVPRRTVDGDRVLVARPESDGGYRVRAAVVNVLHFLRQRIPGTDPDETQWAVLESGIDPGSRVILTNIDELSEGMLVTVEPVGGSEAGVAPGGES
jgi:RND family efflux transporter MFP subunit